MSLASIGEDAAARLVEAQGARVVARNWHGGGGELDLVVLEDGVLVFVEVKTRKASIERAIEAIDAPKTRKLQRAAEAFVAELDVELPCRFDTIAIVVSGPTIRAAWERNAFLAS